MSANASLDSPTDEKYGADFKSEYAHQEATAPKSALEAIGVRVVNRPEELASAESKQVGSAALAAALSKSAINPTSKESFTLYACCFITFGVNGMTTYQNYFKTGTVGDKVSQIFSMYTVGSLIGAFSAGPISDRFGRKWGMFAGGCVIVAGTAIVGSAHKIEQLIGGRFVLGWGIAIMTVAAPSYCVEIAPPHWRGKFVGFYNCGWFGGAIPAAAITFGTNYMSSNWGWRLPMLMQGFAPFLVMCSVYFIPESPRWLMANGREEEALAFLTKYHGNNNPDSALVQLQWIEFKENIELDASDKRWWDYRALFATKNARYRFLQVMMISVFGQFSGNGLGYFNVVIYKNLGYNSSAVQLALNLANQVASAICALTAAAFTDRMPRIKILTFGTAGCAVLLAINAGLSEVWARQPVDAEGIVINPKLGVGQGALAAYFLFNALFSFTYTPLQGVFPTENLENTARAKGMAFSGVCVSLIGFINTYAGPIALQNIKNRYVFVFVGWDLVEAAAWWTLGVETQSRTLEELDDIYNAPYPPFASRKKQTIAVKDGEVLAALHEEL
ncbi:hypothetical protein QFC24_003514 [Naganishia onofrii]|uniref:Uncharacterized protein n=1 Tax=Naganishia onofrii TaxID=1851511 RepID=A0ACC2XJF9_9TREE|nr:hypothetical protein QFC24_003514 [Naganishia onofrii]